MVCLIPSLWIGIILPVYPFQGKFARTPTCFEN